MAAREGEREKKEYEIKTNHPLVLYI